MSGQQRRRQAQQGLRGGQGVDARGPGGQTVAIGREGVAGQHPALARRQRQRLGRAHVHGRALDPACGIAQPFVGGAVDLVHAGVEHGQHAGGAVGVARLLGHGQQGVDGQHRPAGAVGQALRHRAGGAQAREGTGPAAEDDGVQPAQREPGLGQQAPHGRDQRGRRLRAAGAGVRAHRVAVLDGDGQMLGAGVEGKQVHGRHCLKPARGAARPRAEGKPPRCPCPWRRQQWRRLQRRRQSRRSLESLPKP